MNAITKCAHRDMTLVDVDDRFTFSCQRCHQMGYKTCYVCATGCDYQVHEECITASRVAECSFWTTPFILDWHLSAVTEGLCTACGKDVKGLMYVCNHPSGRIFLHPCCMKLPHCIETDDGDRFTLKSSLRFVACQYCNRTTLGGPIDGWAYISADQISACHVTCMANKLYEDWLMYVEQQAEMEEVNQGGPWWVGLYDQDDSLVPSVGSSGSSTNTSPPSSSHFSPDVSHQQSNLALTTVTGPPTGRKRKILWKFTKVAIKLFIHVTTGDPVSLIMAVHDLV